MQFKKGRALKVFWEPLGVLVPHFENSWSKVRKFKKETKLKTKEHFKKYNKCKVFQELTDEICL